MSHTRTAAIKTEPHVYVREVLNRIPIVLGRLEVAAGTEDIDLGRVSPAGQDAVDHIGQVEAWDSRAVELGQDMVALAVDIAGQDNHKLPALADIAAAWVAVQRHWQLGWRYVAPLLASAAHTA